MTIITCPSDVVRAPADRIWDLLTMPRELEAWAETRVLRGPPRRLAAGDDLVLGAGPAHRFRVHFHIARAERPEELAIDVRLPFDVINHEVIRISPNGPDRCRVTYN